MPFLIDLPTPDLSERFARQLATCLISPLVVTFRGDIGAGKTTIIRAMLRALGILSAIKSPTFSLVETYQTHSFKIHHIDLYRISDESELEYVGFRDYFSQEAICCIEWPERVANWVDWVDLDCSLSLKGDGRTLQCTALSSKGSTILTCLKGLL